MSESNPKAMQTDINKKLITWLRIKGLERDVGIIEMLEVIIKRSLTERWEGRSGFLTDRVTLDGEEYLYFENPSRQNVYTDQATIEKTTERAKSLGFSVRQDYIRLCIGYAASRIAEVMDWE